MLNKLSAVAIFATLSCAPASANDDLCSLVKATVAGFASGGWGDFRGAQRGEAFEGFATYASLKTFPGFDSCSFIGGEVQLMSARKLTCKAHTASLDVSNQKVKEVGDVLHKCLPGAKPGKSTVDKQDIQYFQLENLAMVSVTATAPGFLVEPDNVGYALEIGMNIYKN